MAIQREIGTDIAAHSPDKMRCPRVMFVTDSSTASFYMVFRLLINSALGAYDNGVAAEILLGKFAKISSEYILNAYLLLCAATACGGCRHNNRLDKN